MDTSSKPAETSLKPRVLLADDSRIVRAAIMKQVQGVFDFCEAGDGEQAWDMLLQDASIRIVVTDLTMPRLDGYGLLARIRQTADERLRTLPVVVVSGNDGDEERERAKAAGATHLIVKNVNTPQLLSQLGVLMNLATSQSDYIDGLRNLMCAPEEQLEKELPSSDSLFERAQGMLAYAIRFKRNVVMLSMCIGIRHTGERGQTPPPLAGVMMAIGSLLQASVRQTDVVAKVSAAEFAIASGSMSLDAARRLAERLSGAIVGADILKDKGIVFIASCGVMSLDEYRAQHPNELPDIELLWNHAHIRGRLGLRHGLSGVIGMAEEANLQN
jgi:two-component system cell cycle response regulator